VTVPVDQRSAGRTDVFDLIAPTFTNAD
jgi:hypothetical protein